MMKFKITFWKKRKKPRKNIQKVSTLRQITPRWKRRRRRRDNIKIIGYGILSFIVWWVLFIIIPKPDKLSKAAVRFNPGPHLWGLVDFISSFILTGSGLIPDFFGLVGTICIIVGLSKFIIDLIKGEG